MSTEPTDQRPLLPRYVIASIASGVLGLLTLILSGSYFALAAAGNVPTPPVGLGPLLSAAIAVLFLVPIAHWAAHCAAKPGLQQIAELRTEVREAMDKFGEQAIESARKTGQLQGIIGELRNGTVDDRDAADVVSIVERVRRGS